MKVFSQTTSQQDNILLMQTVNFNILPNQSHCTVFHIPHHIHTVKCYTKVFRNVTQLYAASYYVSATVAYRGVGRDGQLSLGATCWVVDDHRWVYLVSKSSLVYANVGIIILHPK